MRAVRRSIAAFFVVLLLMPCLNAAGQSASNPKSPSLHSGLLRRPIEHMQASVELAPDAPDAQTARDKISIWQVKAKT